jgi:hypothetical protein
MNCENELRDAASAAGVHAAVDLWKINSKQYIVKLSRQVLPRIKRIG